MPEDRPPLDVAVAVIERAGQLLISQRLPDDSFGGFWEFPGGKLKEGESMEEGLTREIQEELGVRITVGIRRMVIEHRYPGRTIRLHCFDCRLLDGEPRPVECADCRWVQPHELEQFKFPPASRPLLDVIANEAKQSQ